VSPETTKWKELQLATIPARVGVGVVIELEVAVDKLLDRASRQAARRASRRAARSSGISRRSTV
jgi:hypothetical protein